MRTVIPPSLRGYDVSPEELRGATGKLKHFIMTICRREDELILCRSLFAGVLRGIPMITLNYLWITWELIVDFPPLVWEKSDYYLGEVKPGVRFHCALSHIIWAVVHSEAWWGRGGETKDICWILAEPSVTSVKYYSELWVMGNTWAVVCFQR